MDESRVVKRIFIGSASDLQEERILFRDVVIEVNKIKAHQMGIDLEAIGWEDTLPGKGRPQHRINEDLKKCDLVILVLWKRWGTPTGKYSSGIEEEFEIAYKLNRDNNAKPDIVLYFKSIPTDMMSDPGKQLKRVLKFRNKIEKEKKFLFRSFENARDWEYEIRFFICNWLDGVQTFRKPRGLQRDIAEGHKTIDLTESSVKSNKKQKAARLIKKAKTYEIDRRFTRAEEEFAKAMRMYPTPELYLDYANLLIKMGMYSKALKCIDDIRIIADALEFKVLQVRIAITLASLYYKKDQHSNAKAEIEKAIAISYRVNDKYFVAQCYNNIAGFYREQGFLKKSTEMLKKALKLIKYRRNSITKSAIYFNLGLTKSKKKRYKEAKAMFLRSMSIAKKIDALEMIGRAYFHLGNVYNYLSEWSNSERMYRYSIKEGKRIKSELMVANAYHGLGILYILTNEFVKAKRTLKKSLTIYRSLGIAENIASNIISLGNMSFRNEKMADANTYYNEARSIFVILKNKEDLRDVDSKLKMVENRINC